MKKVRNSILKSARQRADLLLVEKGLCESREKARLLILEGKVRAGKDRVVQKTSEQLDINCEIRIDEETPYVGRGALKLFPALQKHLPDMTGMKAFDIGASTGGFTDLMLHKNAEKVYTVDSGTNQLHHKLRHHNRVSWKENINARNLPDDFLPEKVDVVTMDLSFISATKVIPSADKFLKPNGMAFILVKPQFEAEKKDIGKGGVVKDPAVIDACVQKVANFATSLGWEMLEIIPSGLKGPKGNREQFIVFRKK